MKTEELRRYYDCYHFQRANEALSDIDLNLQFIESLEILKTGSKIIEVGSGRCELAKALQGEGFNLIASDISFGVLSNNAAENVIQARAEDIPFPSDFFDIALGFDVIEHFPDIETHLEEVNRVLKEGGQYIFETPNLLISRFWERLKGNSFSEQRIYHPSVQSYWGLKDVFTRSGFEVELVKMPFMEGKAPDELNGIFGKASNVFQRIDWERWPQFLYPMFYGVAEKHI